MGRLLLLPLHFKMSFFFLFPLLNIFSDALMNSSYAAVFVGLSSKDNTIYRAYHMTVPLNNNF